MRGTRTETNEAEEPDSTSAGWSFRAKTLARGFRRRCANLAWGFGVPVLVGFTWMLAADLLPSWFGVLAAGSFGCALMTVMVSTLVARSRERELRFAGLEGADGKLTLVNHAGRDQTVEDIQGAVFSKKQGWLVRRSGDVVQLTFVHKDQAQQATALLTRALRAPLVLLPKPSRIRHPFLLFFGALFFSNIAEEFWPIPMAAGFAVLSLVMAGVVAWRRGRKLVIASDGVRIGSRFYSLDQLTEFECGRGVVKWRHAGKARRAKVRLPEDLAFALEVRVRELIEAEAPVDDALERREGEEVHAWLKRVAGLVRGGDFREPAVSRDRALGAAHGKGSLRVRVAALAALKDEAPELIEELGQDFADPRFARVFEVAAGDEADWRKVIDALERRGELDAPESSS